DYQTNDNDQAVVEICITRITTAIRETASIERHGRALVALWESCLEHNLKPSGKDEDAPHAKIASDIMSCILQNYNRPPVMALAVPVAVKFLQRGNKELCRNMSSYLSLAAIAKAELLAEHTETILRSVLQGNWMLLRVLPALLEQRPRPILARLPDLVAPMAQLDPPEQLHLLRLLHTVARKRQLGALKECLPFLFGHLRDPNHSEVILNILLEISSYEPAALAPFLPTLREIGEAFPTLIGQTAKIFGAVGHLDEVRWQTKPKILAWVGVVFNLYKSCFSFHHLALLCRKSLARHAGPRSCQRLPGVFIAQLGLQPKFQQVLVSGYEVPEGRRKWGWDPAECRARAVENSPEAECPVPLDDLKSVVNGSEEDEKLQVKIQAFEEKINVDSSTPGSVRRYSLGQVSKEERKDMRFNRSKSLALHALRMKGLSSEGGQDEENGDIPPGISFSELCLSQQHEKEPVGVHPEAGISHPSAELAQAADEPELSLERAGQGGAGAATAAEQHQDKLYLHLKEILPKVKEFVMEMGRRIPIPEQCVIEDTVQSCVAKLSFSCPLKGHYCLYSKSSFTLVSQQPPLWIHIMFLFQQVRATQTRPPLGCSCGTWTRILIKLIKFPSYFLVSLLPRQDLEKVQMHLEEVRFFDLFGYSEEAGAWQCFMCNNPEKATGVNQDGQPLMEGKLKEKQVRWKFIKRWKTRYFTLAGNQLLFRRGKSKDDPDESPIELSKVQSVRAVARKRRERSLPRAFEIFTESRSYVLKASDERAAEEWLQCLSVAVAQAHQRQSREATTYL
ncbi:MELT protein, partial [Cercotrichas coryphoeus]|nr:MELT protein [Cercotrichas coryphoeus]